MWRQFSVNLHSSTLGRESRHLNATGKIQPRFAARVKKGHYMTKENWVGIWIRKKYEARQQG